MIYRFLAIVLAAFMPFFAYAANPAAILEMYPYVEGRDFPWAVPVIGLLCLGVYVVRRIVAERDIDGLGLR